MNFRIWFISIIWLVVGLWVLGVSLVQEQRLSLWNITKPTEIMATESAGFQRQDGDFLIDSLPDVEVLPGDWNYYPKVLENWIWWRIAKDNDEKARRLMQLANERLKAGWLLCNEGRYEHGLETVTKGEIYLNLAMDLYKKQGDEKNKELVRVATLHENLLKNMEKEVPEEMRPRFTELINFPSRVLD